MEEADKEGAAMNLGMKITETGGRFFRRDGIGRFAERRWGSLEEARRAEAAAREAYLPKATIPFGDAPEPPEPADFTVEQVDPASVGGKWWVSVSAAYPIAVAVGNCLHDVAEERATLMSAALNGLLGADKGWHGETRFMSAFVDAYRLSVAGRAVAYVAFDKEIAPDKTRRAAEAVVDDRGARKAIWHGREK